jgi:hypothetical protein
MPCWRTLRAGCCRDERVAVSGRIEVDYEELHRMSRVWSAAAAEFSRLAAAVAALGALPSMLRGFLLDPMGAARAESALMRAAVGPAGLAGLAATVAADSVRLDAVVHREQLADDLPLRQAAAVAADLVELPWTLAIAPVSTLRADRHDAGVLADGVMGALAPFTETLLAATAPAPVFGRRPGAASGAGGSAVRSPVGRRRSDRARRGGVSQHLGLSTWLGCHRAGVAGRGHGPGRRSRAATDRADRCYGDHRS